MTDAGAKFLAELRAYKVKSSPVIPPQHVSELQTLTPADAARYAGKSRREIKRLVANGTLRWVLVQRKRRIPRYQLDELAAR